MHLTETQLNDYLDGILDPVEAARARQHVEACDACARAVEQIAALKSSLAALPRDIQPDRDLRADIWSRIDGDEPVVARHTRTLRSVRYPLAAAAVLLVAISSVVTLAIVQRTGDSHGTGEDYRNTTRLVARDPSALQREYSAEVRELEMILQKSRGALAPETVRIMEENLRIIDRAIGEARTALAADPNSEMLVDLLRSAYERKLELLRQAARSSPVT